MLYLIAILFPPLAVLLAGKPIQAVLNLVLTLFFYVPGLIHAILVVHDKKADKRMKRQAEIIAKSKRTTK
ncbi:YqaE/Pmp3 family membrane protein [Peribacillus frigoritolerans]